MRGRRWLYLLLALALLGLAPAAMAQEGGAPPAAALAYQGAEVKTQVDVNGVAAMQLVGSALDAIVAQAQEQIKAMQANPEAMKAMGPGQDKLAIAAAAMPVVEPMKEAIKSLEHITVLDMKPKGAVEAGEFTKYYSDLMTAQGWSPLVSVRDEGGTVVLAMTAPQAKGVFFAVHDHDTMVAAVVTTTKPIGDLIAQVIQASGSVMPAVMSQMMSRPQPVHQVSAPAQPKHASPRARAGKPVKK